MHITEHCAILQPYGLGIHGNSCFVEVRWCAKPLAQAMRKIGHSLAPTLQRGSKSRRSSVASALGPLERPRLHSHAERGNEKKRTARKSKPRVSIQDGLGQEASEGGMRRQHAAAGVLAMLYI
jgi:hypothetical protein